MKIRLTILLFALFIYTNQKVFSQSYFNNLFSPDITLSKTIIVEENGFFAIGHRPTFVDRQIILYKLNSSGDTIWQKYYGDTPDIYYAQKVLPTSNGYIIAGSVTDTAGDNNFDFFLSNFDSTGTKQWMYRYGGSDFESLNDLRQTTDGNFILTGTTSSYGAGSGDFYIVKTDSLGNFLWQNFFGGG